VARYPTYRGTEEAVHISVGDTWIGFRPADGGKHVHYEVGLEHLGLEVDSREEVDEAHRRAVEMGAKIHFPPEEDRDIPGYWAFFVFDPDGFRVELFPE
jgi:catechol 2,3-dioxygenase-like lactoylglutathione lyase family enzyme